MHATEERPLRRDASRNRERVMQAARELFAERGLHVTMDEIARHAGVGVGTAYRRFENREVLVWALFEERMDEYVAMSDEAAADPDPWRGLVRFMERSVAAQAADRGLKDLLWGHEHVAHRIASVRERIRPGVEDLIRRAQAAGTLRADAAPSDLALVSIMLGQVIDFSHDVEPDLWRRYLALLLDGLRAGGRDLPVGPLEPDQVTTAMSRFKRR